MRKRRVSEEELKKRRQAKDEEIVKRFRELWPRIRGYLGSITPPEHLDEVADATRFYFVSELLNKSFKEEHELERWAFAVARNTRNEFLRRKSRRALTFFNLDALEAATQASYSWNPPTVEERGQ